MLHENGAPRHMIDIAVLGSGTSPEADATIRDGLRTESPARSVQFFKESRDLLLSHAVTDVRLVILIAVGPVALIASRMQTLATLRLNHIIVIVPTPSQQDVIALLDAGAHACLPTSISPDLLRAHVRSCLRQASVACASVERGDAVRSPERARKSRRGATHSRRDDLTHDGGHVGGSIEFDAASQQVILNGTPIHLTPKEYQLLATLIEHAGTILTYETLYRSVWGDQIGDQRQYVRVFMRALRRKLEADPSKPRFLRTAVGHGYYFASE